MTEEGKTPKPELLAPAGSIEAFWAAIEAGADAVYIGLKGWNARASAVNFSLRDCEILTRWAAARGKRIYIALNALARASVAEEVKKLICRIASIEPHGVIVQDLGIIYLFKKLFPDVPLHLSTLAGIHTLDGIKAAQSVGAKRVVLARELPLSTVVQFAKASPIELEVFVHGALCYSYSGFCYASSFRGGKSGLEGKCVQPCRLKFRQGKREGFFLSCNDFCGLRHVPELKRSGVKALKIEGRMKSPDYVYSVVRAYRMILDADGKEAERKAIEEAEAILADSPSRKFTEGFWSDDPSSSVLTPHRSGTSGIWVGVVQRMKGRKAAVVKVRRSITVGDLLRPESNRGKEEPLARVKSIQTMDGKELKSANAGTTVLIVGMPQLPEGSRLFRVGSAWSANVLTNPREIWNRIKSETVTALSLLIASEEGGFQAELEIPDIRRQVRKSGKKLILKIGSTAELPMALNSPAKWVILKATLSNLRSLSEMRLLKAQKERLILSLPSPYMESDNLRRAIMWFISKGFILWEVNNLAHLELLKGCNITGTKLGIVAGVRLNIRNHFAIAHLAELGCSWVTLSAEMSEGELRALMDDPLPAAPIVTVFHWMPIMISALHPKLMEQKPFFSPRGEGYVYKKQGSFALVFPDRPVSWFAFISDLEKMGYRLFEIDISEGPRSLRKDLSRLLSGFKRERSDEPYSIFNWRREDHANMRTSGLQSARRGNR
ncbi:MAG: U32 family peptidase [Deltaproteobacteria bacterium]|nr:U32 family peptidase [Deltaproteobacteria bacterium]MBW2068802.1 U32 family peptidase [Deltaproteobacteria bacterium]